MWEEDVPHLHQYSSCNVSNLDLSACEIAVLGGPSEGLTAANTLTVPID